jgi:hypothetical protein
MKKNNNNKQTKSTSQKVTTPTAPRQRTPPSENHYANSAFFNSPDPSKLPVPVFDEDDFFFGLDNSSTTMASETAPATKTNTLKQFLNIRSNNVLIST